jgi:predicted N-acetyltransferase YhbS
LTELVALNSVAADDVETLLDDAFGVDRFKRTAYLLRTGMPVIEHLSFAATDCGSALGSIQCWPVSVGKAPLILVGPVAVASQRQGQGIGHRLMHAALAALRPGDAPMVMIGDPEYYGRFGFHVEGTDGWTLPGPWEAHRLLLRNPDGIPLPQTGMLGPRTSL